jgi:hypothetical protein
MSVLLKLVIATILLIYAFELDPIFGIVVVAGALLYSISEEWH